MKTFAKKLKELDRVIDIQSQNGNWNYDGYMHGLLNGMLLARSIMTDSEPTPREAPQKWLADKTLLQKIKLWWLKMTNTMVVKA